MSTSQRQTPATLRSRVQTVATVGLAIYGAYKLGEWLIEAIWESSTSGKNEEDGAVTSPTSSNPPPPPPPPPCLNRETERKLQRHRRIACAKDSLALMQRVAPALYESITDRTSIAAERHELKRLRGDTAVNSTQRQQALWRNVQTKTLLRLFLTMLAESLLFTVTWLHIHWAASSCTTRSSSASPASPVLSSSQSSTLFRTLFRTVLAYLDLLERQCRDAIVQRTNDWDTHSDAALHMTYAKFRTGLDGCIAAIMDVDSLNNENKNDVWMNYVATLEREFADSAVAITNDVAVADELLDWMESPLAKKAFPALFQALYVDNSVRNLQHVYAAKGELPLAQVIAKLSKQSFAQGERLDQWVGLPEVLHISHVFFPED